MRRFHCFFQWDENERDDWDGVINQITCFGSHYEVLIASRSNIRVLFGKCTSGLFICLPDYLSGCNLSDDTFYNSERLIYAIGNPVDIATVAYALKSLADVLDLH